MRPSAHARSRSSSVRMPSSRYKRRHRLGPDALQMEQVENRRRKLGDELAVVRGVAGLRDLDDPRGEVLADAGNFPQAGLVQRARSCG